MEFLFERLTVQRRTPDSGARLREAVRKQIQWLVGSRDWRAEQEMKGLLDIALPALPSLGTGGTQLRHYVERLKRLIERHEPRLTQVRVELRVTGRTLSPFTVVVCGLLAQDGSGKDVRFEYEPGPRDVHPSRS